MSDEAHARRFDPHTSHDAAASLTSQRIRVSQDAVLRFLRQYGPCTDRHMEMVYPALQKMLPTTMPQQSESGLRTRRSELVYKGLVVDTGQRDLLPTGRHAIVWKAV